MKTPPPEVLLAAIVDSSDDAIISKDLDGTITSWNLSAERILGYPRSEAVGMSVMRLLAEGFEPEERALLSRIRKGERQEHFETKRRRKDGSLIDVAVTVSPIRSPDGEIIGASTVIRNITEQKRSKQAGLLLAAIVNSSDDAIVSKGLDGIITSWNQGAYRMFGYSEDEAIGKSILMLIPVDRKDEEAKILQRLRAGERVDHFETMRVRKNGEHFPVSLTISPLRDLAGVIIGASKIARDITDLRRIAIEREQLLESERVARSHAEHANRMKDEFLATISHELRTPLNAIVGWTQVLKEAAHHPQEVLEGVGIIERNALVQAQLIEDMLDLGRITSGKMKLEVDWVDIAGIVHEAIASVRHAAETKNVVIKTILDDVRGGMRGDKRRLQQIIWNLLTNSIKFTPKGGRVVVVIARVKSHVEISVSDNGRGIAADFLPHVFERFRQGDGSTTRQSGGLGIGLAIVKQLVELHGGEVRAESPGINFGTTVTVSLPIAFARPEGDSQPKDSREPLNNGGELVRTELTGIKVLAVDDDRDSLEVLRRILTNRNAEVETAGSAEDGLLCFAAFRPHVILSDIGMPGSDGYDFIRRIRGLPGGSTIPAAALTALARSEDRTRALQAGFQTHVSKPIAPAELIAIVQSLAAINSTPKDEGLGGLGLS